MAVSPARSVPGPCAVPLRARSVAAERAWHPLERGP
jgi:hypothetical protein